jgi:shikimate kinase
MEQSGKLANKQIILAGFMGSGKTTVGEKLALLLGRTFVDTDQKVEKKTGMKVAEIFSIHGEAIFRKMETEAVESLTAYPLGELVVATGGGALISSRNREILKSCGLLILLAASPRAILSRTKGQGDRPLLEGHPKPLSKIEQLLEERAPYYETCDLQVDTSGKNADQVTGEIIERLGLKPS